MDDQAATRLLHSAAASVDGAWPGTQPTHIEITTRWPAFALTGKAPLRRALLDAAHATGQ